MLLSPEHFDLRPNGAYVQQVRVTVRLRDGSETNAMFPYPFIYASEKANPFITDSALSADGGVFVQQPPPGSDISKFPLTVQTVLTHTDPASGKTTFPECPEAQAHK